MHIEKYLQDCRRRVEVALKKNLPAKQMLPSSLHQAMSYSVLGKGKRLRAALVYAIGEAFGANKKVLDKIACVIEIVHASSLIHDDLPALDNDDLRRGKPTCHKMYGEATAILAGDALQTLAYQILADLPENLVNPTIKLKLIAAVAQSGGSTGMSGGEEMDIAMVNKKVSVRELETMYKLKTGHFLMVCIISAALAANCSKRNVINNLKQFSLHLGLAFQIHDDIIGLLSDTKTLGKQQGADLMLNKPTYPQLVGFEKARAREKFLVKKAITYLVKVNVDMKKIRLIAEYILRRNH